MAIQWMDNFNIYGTDAGRNARLLNGLYAETVRASLEVDPDATAGGTYVMLKYGGGLGGDLRKVLTTARTTIGSAARFWFSSLPVALGIAECPTMWSFRDQNNVPHIEVTLDPAGDIIVNRVDGAARVQLGITATPAIVANAWLHFEVKVVLDVAAGSVEVRREGLTVLLVNGVRTTNNVGGAILSCLQVAQTSCQDGAGPGMYMKDYIVWDGTGTNNNFLGSCQVFKIIPDGDIALNWNTSAGGTGYNLINETSPDDDVSYISAPFPLPAGPYKCSLTDLPLTVTSVKGVMPVHRSRKTDGGDGNIQTGVISGAATGLGTDRPITTAYTYWYDIMEVDPNTAGAWTRLAVNNMNMQINRTV